MELLALGRIGRPHGIRGEVRLQAYNPESEVLPTLQEVRLSEDGPPIRVESIRRGGGGHLLKLAGVDDRDAAAALVHKDVWVPRSMLPEPEEGWYLSDLVGLQVTDTAGAPLGEVVGVEEAGPYDLLEVRRDAGLWLLPAVEPLLVSVDHEAGRMVVDPPDGLLDLESLE